MGTGIPDQEPQTRNQELGNHGTGTMEQEQRLQEQSCSGTQRCQTGTGQYGNRNPRPGATNQELGNHGTGTPEQEQRFQEQHHTPHKHHLICVCSSPLLNLFLKFHLGVKWGDTEVSEEPAAMDRKPKSSVLWFSSVSGCHKHRLIFT
ncbi:uncharacterized protein LOC114018255 isoform X2 [Chelonia mydas]|uniref:uncharacterized protein LOC114018255 isoform X2 n=1 Tax=Chelonia mydas TaxID=8469 RepID=UPI0018A1ECBB|nr:uncharacterized protein LOC114018255 isoform X2 [Chelonia mydas]